VLSALHHRYREGIFPKAEKTLQCYRPYGQVVWHGRLDFEPLRDQQHVACEMLIALCSLMKVRNFRLTNASNKTSKRLRLQFAAEESRPRARVQVNRKFVPYE
jgi:hypothetical protein